MADYMNNDIIIQFDKLFIKNHFFIPQTDELFKSGCKIVQSKHYNNQIKTDILYKLITIYPNKYILYYWMGYLQLYVNIYNAYYWFYQCYKIEPTYIENLLDMLKILFDNEHFTYIQKINDDNRNILYTSTDTRIMVFIAAYESKMKRFSNSIELYKRIINNKNIELEDDLKIKCYSNMGIISNDLGIQHTAIKYLEYATSMIRKETQYINKETVITFSNLFTSYDYMYQDIEHVYSNFLNFDKLSLKTNNYDFKSHKQNTKIKIGYVSGDFNGHAVSNFIHPILQYNHRLFEVHCFSISLKYQKIPYDHIINHNVLNINSIQKLADYIYTQKIDILIDLVGHTQPNRIEVFSLNPAPIQITYLGFPNTTGLSSIKYRITDNIANHPDSKQPYSETLYKLPKCFLLYNYKTNIKNRKTPSNDIILGAVNKENKTSIYTLNVWKQILSSCKNVKLLILLKSNVKEEVEKRETYYCKTLKVLPNRLLLIPHLTTYEEYNELFGKVDIVLDPFPYSGTTTTCNAMNSSIPVITKYHKDYHSHNVSASLLINSGFPELVAYSDDEYVNKVKSLISSPTQIDKYKETIRPKFLELMEPTQFMESYNKMLLNIYKKEQQNE